MELPTFGAILLDEMVGGDKADLASLKNFVTGSDWARRPMRSNMIEKVKVRATLLGTSNHTLGKIIYDSTGARRFIELDVLPRSEIEPNWNAIANYNWLQLWQAVDAEAADPLMSSEFAELLMVKQEELRNLDNAETWLRQFEPTRTRCKDATSEYVEYFAADFYEEFVAWEKEYDRGWKGTSLTRWGRDMKSLIANGRVPGWTHHKVGTRTVYRVSLAVVPERASLGSNVVRAPWTR
jgi:hypothetical protein